jgi:hypothetical protein
MPSLHKIKAREILNDIRSGISDEGLMEKYELSIQALQSALDQLRSCGLVSGEELDRRSIENAERETTTVTTRLPKDYLVIQVPVYDVENPSIAGTIRDMTEEEIGIIGIAANLDDIRSFVIQPGEAQQIDKLLLKAKCRWVKKNSIGEYVCGFKIIDVSPENQGKLRLLVEELNWGG